MGALEYSFHCPTLSPATVDWPPRRASSDSAGATWDSCCEPAEFPYSQLCCTCPADCWPRCADRVLLRLEIPGRLPQSSSRDRLKLGAPTCPRGQCLIFASRHLFVVASCCQTQLKCIHAAPPTRSRINSSGLNKGGSMWTKQQPQTEPSAVPPATGPASSVTPFSAPSASRSSGSAAQLTSEIHAAEVVVYGKVVGNVHARDRVDVKTDGSVVGDISTARISIEDGAHFKGRIEIDPAKSQSAAD